MAAEPKWQQDFSDHPDEWTDEDEIEWQEANASRFAPDDRQLGQISVCSASGSGSPKFWRHARWAAQSE